MIDINFLSGKEEFVVTWCPVCECQRQLHNLWYLFGKEEHIGMYIIIKDFKSLMIGYYCYACDCVVYKNVAEGRIL